MRKHPFSAIVESLPVAEFDAVVDIPHRGAIDGIQQCCCWKRCPDAAILFQKGRLVDDGEQRVDVCKVPAKEQLGIM